MRHRCTLMVLAVLALALALPASALGADAEYEPNDGIDQAYGPLAANTNYNGTISTENDRDWYIVYVSGQGVLGVSLNEPHRRRLLRQPVRLSAQCRRRTLNSSHGKRANRRTHLHDPRPRSLLRRVSRTARSPTYYRLRVSGPITTGPRPGPPDEVTPNNNPEAASAFGPLQGGRLYAGSIDAYNEQDWFYFYTSGAGAFDISLINIYDGSSYDRAHPWTCSPRTANRG